jgi:hypothetical protein
MAGVDRNLTQLMGVVFDLKMSVFLQLRLYPQTFLEGRIRAFCGVSRHRYPGNGARTGPGFPGEGGRGDGILSLDFGE